MKTYKKIEGTPFELKTQLFYSLGGLNYFTCKSEPRGYYLSVSPVQVDRRADGIIVESYTAFTGKKILLLECKRQSKKSLKIAESLVDSKKEQLENYIIQSIQSKNFIL